MWDDDLWTAPDRPGDPGSAPNAAPGDKPPKPAEPDEDWSPEVPPPGPQSTRAKATVVIIAVALLVGTVILCCTALNRLAELYFLDLNPIHLL